MIKRLKDEEFQVKRLILFTLGELGAEAKDSIPYLMELVKDKDKEISKSATNALEKITNSLEQESQK